jgi:lactoylglutathione lyase
VSPPSRDHVPVSEGSFPIVSVPDLRAAQRFYEQLGFVETYRFPTDGEPAFVSLERGGAALGLGGGSDAPGWSYWIYVDDVDATVDAMRRSGAEVVDEPRDEPWGERVARVRDPAGNDVHLGAESRSVER